VHSVKPALQENPQLVPLQVGDELAGPAGHAVQLVVPHELTDELLEQLLVPQAW
jgi:hypothetical protein